MCRMGSLGELVELRGAVAGEAAALWVSEEVHEGAGEEEHEWVGGSRKVHEGACEEHAGVGED